LLEPVMAVMDGEQGLSASGRTGPVRAGGIR
jgi:hypothetical protein